jgi:hypothetical protein
VLAVLDFIKDKMNMAQAISSFIQKSPNITDDFLERNYSMIMKVALESNEEKMTAEAQQRLQQIASIEKMNGEKEKKDQEEAEDMLKNM